MTIDAVLGVLTGILFSVMCFGLMGWALEQRDKRQRRTRLHWDRRPGAGK